MAEKRKALKTGGLHRPSLGKGINAFNEGKGVRILERLKEGYIRIRPESKRLFEKAGKVIPGGIVASLKYMDPFPVYMKKGEGSKIYDVDGLEYIDYKFGYSAMPFGHGHPEIKKALEDCLKTRGTTLLGAPNDLEVEVAGKLVSIFNVDEARFFATGQEATYNAVRLVRAFTGKPMIAKFEGHYHGSNDYLLCSVNPPLELAGPAERPTPVPDSAGISQAIIDNTLVLPFNNLEATEKLITEHKKKLAGVIMEPFSRGFIPSDRRFLEGLREICNKHGIPLIFDEVMTGFAAGLGGAQKYYRVNPDLICLGKSLGNGTPVSALLGRRDIMETFSPIGREEHGRYLYHSSTYPGFALGLASTKATLEILERKGTYAGMFRATERLKKGIERLIADKNIEAQIMGIGVFFNILFTKEKIEDYRDWVAKADRLKRSVFDFTLLNNGIFVYPNGRFTVTLAHTDNDIDKTLDAFDLALDNTQLV